MRAQLITPDYPQPERGNSPPYIAETYMYLLRPASPHFASLEIPTSLPACRRTTTRPSRHRDYTMQYCTFAAAQLTRDPSAPSLSLALSLSRSLSISSPLSLLYYRSHRFKYRVSAPICAVSPGTQQQGERIYMHASVRDSIIQAGIRSASKYRICHKGRHRYREMYLRLPDRLF
jgi:hypothetical protein